MSSSWRNALLVLGLALLLATVYFAGPAEFAGTLAKADAGKLALAALALVAMTFVNVFKFHFLAVAVEKKTRFRDSARVVCFSQVVNQGMVAVAGEAAKGVLFKKLHGITLSRALSVVAVERFQDVAVMLALSLLVIVQLDAGLFWTAAALFALAFAAGLLVLLAPERWLKKIPFGFARENLAEFRGGMKTIPLRFFAASFAASLASYAIGGVANALILSALGFDVDFFVVLSVTAAASLVGMLSALPGGLGARELALAGIYSQFGVANAAAVASSVVMRVFFSAENYAAYLLAARKSGR